jgi:hypothetical protein
MPLPRSIKIKKLILLIQTVKFKDGQVDQGRATTESSTF